MWERLTPFLARQGLPGVAVLPASEPPGPDPRSGKFRQVWAARPPLEEVPLASAASTGIDGKGRDAPARRRTREPCTGPAQ